MGERLMWRRIRTALDTDPSVELVDAAAPTPVAVSPEALAAATLGPAPLTDAELVKRLQQELTAARGTIGRLNEKLAAPPPEPRPFHGCPGCAELRRTVAELQAAGREDRATIARLTLADPAARARVLPYVERAVE